MFGSFFFVYTSLCVSLFLIDNKHSPMDIKKIPIYLSIHVGFDPRHDTTCHFFHEQIQEYHALIPMCCPRSHTTMLAFHTSADQTPTLCHEFLNHIQWAQMDGSVYQVRYLETLRKTLG